MRKIPIGTFPIFFHSAGQGTFGRLSFQESSSAIRCEKSRSSITARSFSTAAKSLGRHRPPSGRARGSEAGLAALGSRSDRKGVSSVGSGIGNREFLTPVFRALFVTISRAVHAISGSGPCCRFTPTCSCYAEEAFRIHGIRRGALLLTRRLMRCHPFGGAGFDPVPER